MRYLGIDLGDARTGLALGDDETGIVTPMLVLEVPIARRGGQELLDALTRAIGENLGTRGVLVLGLPLNMDDSEGPQAKKVRAFAARLQERLLQEHVRQNLNSGPTPREQIAIAFQDERLTSAQADWSMARSGLTRGEKKQKRDALAAASILSDFLASKRK